MAMTQREKGAADKSIFWICCPFSLLFGCKLSLVLWGLGGLRKGEFGFLNCGKAKGDVELTTPDYSRLKVIHRDIFRNFITLAASNGLEIA